MVGFGRTAISVVVASDSWNIRPVTAKAISGIPWWRSFHWGVAIKTWLMVALMASTCWRSVTF